MPDNATTEEEMKPFEVITYLDAVAFNFTLPDEEEPQTIEHELTFVWEDTLEKFFEEHGTNKPYRVKRFRREREQKFLIDQIILPQKNQTTFSKPLF